MKVVILKTNEVKNVADGYARNYLIPNGLAVPATEKKVKEAEEQAAKMEESNAKATSAWDEFAQKADSLKVALTAEANEDGTLFAAVSSEDIAAAISKVGSIEIEAGWISVTEPIKSTGEHTVSVAFPASQTVKVTVLVESK